MLATIGYEAADPDDFILTLKAAGVDCLIDIRDRAQSRRKGFSKTQLSNLLAEADIEYLHLKSLGDPKEGREAARAKDFSRFRSIYRNVLETPAAKDAVNTIIDQLDTKKVCLLCYERDPLTCHRKMVADTIEEQIKIEVSHLGVKKFEPPQRTRRRVLHSNQSATTPV